MIPFGNQAGVLGTPMPVNFLPFVSTISCMARLYYLLSFLGSKQIIPTIIPFQPIFIYRHQLENKLRNIGLKIMLKKKPGQIDDPALILVNNSSIGGADSITLLLY